MEGKVIYTPLGYGASSQLHTLSTFPLWAGSRGLQRPGAVALKRELLQKSPWGVCGGPDFCAPPEFLTQQVWGET